MVPAVTATDPPKREVTVPVNRLACTVPFSNLVIVPFSRLEIAGTVPLKGFVTPAVPISSLTT